MLNSVPGVTVPIIETGGARESLGPYGNEDCWFDSVQRGTWVVP